MSTATGMKTFLCAALILLVSAASACTEVTAAPTGDTTPYATPIDTSKPRPLATRMTALGGGILSDDDGCLRMGRTLLVFPPDQHEVVRKGETVEVTDFAEGMTGPIVWRLGDQITVGGGSTDGRAVPHQPFPDHCSGLYWLVGAVTGVWSTPAAESPSPTPSVQATMKNEFLTVTPPAPPSPTPTWADPYLSIIDRYPVEGSDGIPTETTIQFNLHDSLPVVRVSLWPAVELERIDNEDAEPMGFGRTEVYIYRPHTTLAPNSTYEVTLELGRTEEGGPEDTVTHTWEFTTSDGTDEDFARDVVIPILPSVGEGGNGALWEGALSINGKCLWVGSRTHLPVFEEGTVRWEGDLLFLRGHRYEIGDEVPLGGGERMNFDELPFAQEPDDSCEASNAWINVQ